MNEQLWFLSHSLQCILMHFEPHEPYVLRHEIKSTNSVQSWPEVTTCRHGSSKSIQPLAEVGESTCAISRAHAYGINRFIWRTGQLAGARKPGRFISPYHRLRWPFEIPLTLSLKMPLVLQLRIVKRSHGCICNWDICPYRPDGNLYVIFQSAETGDLVRLLLSLSRNLVSDRLWRAA